ncbi:hypothetical protein JCM3765_005367 [Sporobolomyces pararoseus]
MWSSLSGSLSSYLNPAPTEEASSTSLINSVNTPSTPRNNTTERERGQVSSIGQGDPHTPDQSSQRLSPNSLSASGNQTMAGVLAAHPQFSVFRKSASREGLDELLLDRSRDSTRQERSKTKKDEEDDENRVETLVTPPASSPRADPLEKRNSPSGNSSGSSSFHFSSLEGADLPSLNFGDHSSTASLVGVSPRSSPLSVTTAADRPISPPSSSVQHHSGVRLIPDSPPTTRRSPSLVSSSSASISTSFQPSASSSSSARAARTPSRSSSSSSLSRSQSVTRVGQFSPLSLCPSPLIGAPTLPPPPPPPALSLDHRRTPEERDTIEKVNSLRRTSSILKLPRTPGTGRSVRFTESIIDHENSGGGSDGDAEEEEEEEDEFAREDSPSILPGSRQQQQQQHQRSVPRHQDETEDRTESALDFSAMTSKDSILTAKVLGGGGHSSFLDKLKEVIPSPDVSLEVEQVKEGEEANDVVVEEAEKTEIVSKGSAIGTAEDISRLAENSISCTASTLLPTSTQKTVSTELNIDDPSLSTLAIQAPTNLSSTGAMLFDESNPCHFNHSMSILGSSTLGGGLTARGVDTLEVLTETEEEGEKTKEGQLAIPITPRVSVPSRDGDTSRTPTSNPLRTRLAQESSPEEDVDDSALHQSDLSSTTTSQTPDLTVSQTLDFGQQQPDRTISPVPSLPLENSSTSSSSPTVLPATSTNPESDVSQSQSFYRKFMASRAKLGGSQTAAEEWERLERGEKASPKDHQLRQSNEDDGEGKSVYYLPQQGLEAEEEFEQFEREEDEVERVLVQGGSFYELAPADEKEEEELVETQEGSVVDYGGLIKTFLSPIVELSEPESTANSPFEELVASLKRSQTSRPKPPPSQPFFSSSTTRKPIPSAPLSLAAPSTPSRTITSAPSTPLSTSKIPRPRNPITPSQNPFLLQLARSIPNAPPAIEQQARLLQDLLSTQQNQIETTSSQRFLLSSLVTNLQNEVDQKNRMVENLKRQVQSARKEVQEVERIALEWQQCQQQKQESETKSTTDDSRERRERERRKVAALEETVQLLADELDTRLKENGVGRKRIEGELERTRAELIKRSNEVRETEIRLRHAKANQAQTEEEIRIRRDREETAIEEARASKREVELLRARWQAEAEDRDRTTQRLREELLELKQNSRTPSSSLSESQIESRIEKEVARRVEEAQREVEKDQSIVKQELVLRDKALAELRAQLLSVQEEAHQTRGISQEDRQQAELALADLQLQLSTKEEEASRLREANSELQDELDETIVKLEDASIDRERLIRLLETKEVELAQQQDQCDTAISAMRDLEDAVTRFETEAAVKESQLAKLKKEVELQASVLEKREGVLAESEKQLSRLRKERGALEAEKEKAVAFAEKLKRDSADREIRVSKLKKRIAELDEDVFGLNIALDAKQQEASHWRRQMSQLKVERTQARPESHSAIPPSSTHPSEASTVRRPSNVTSVLSGLENHTLSRPAHSERQGTPLAKPRQLSKRSSRPNLVPVSTSLTQSQSVEHDLTLPDHEETPSRLPPTQATTANSINSARGIRRSSSSSSKLIQFPKLPQGDQDRLGAMVNLGVASSAIPTEGRSRRRASDQGSKENEPITEGGGGSRPGSRRSSASRASSASFSRETILA